MAAHFHLAGAPAIAVQALRAPGFAVTRLQSNAPLPARTSRVPPQKAWLVNVHLRELAIAELWYSGRAQGLSPHRADGGVTIVDLEQEPTVYFGAAFDVLQFYVPHAGLAEVAGHNGAMGIAALSWPIGQCDPMAKYLALGFLPALEQPEMADRLQVDAAMFAINLYFARAYGSAGTARRLVRGGLAPWQLRRATELLSTHLGGDISLAELASECGLSRSHFARAFKQSTGTAPHRWLIERKIERAKNLLSRSRLPMAEVAIASGFADQSHFTRVFAGLVGASPGAWRRAERIYSDGQLIP
jgi:AraC-like DNA-binding protein